MKKIILIKYGELTTKKANRNLFVNKLYESILFQLKGYNVKIKKNRVRMFVETDDNLDEVLEKLKCVFGIHRIVVAYQVNTKVDEIKEKALEVAKNVEFATFKVETHRSDKKFEFASMDFNRVMGSFILQNIPNVKVDVHNPDYLMKIEIREDYAYIYDKEIEGAGGYPAGVAGSGLLMLSGGIDSPVSGYLAMKRGVKLECIYFESPPHTSLQAKNKVKDLVKILARYQGSIKFHVVNFTDIQEAIYKNCDPNYMITIMRRMMYRISSLVMKKNNCLVLLNGESIGQVASQTLHSMQVINDVTNVPVVRPVACFDKLEIIEISKKIGTYDVSILPYEDCCTIFLPKHPVINPCLEKAISEENKFDYDALVMEAVRNVETIKIDSNYNEFDI